LNTSSRIQKLLIIDDHVLFREGLINIFQSVDDFMVLGGAGSVREGIEKAQLLHPDIILMDFSLPDGTGLDATEAVLSEMPECKIVFLTVHVSDNKLFRAIQVGAKGYIPKNIDKEGLISSLRGLERNELAISRRMASHIIGEFSVSNPQVLKKREYFYRLSDREKMVLNELQLGYSNHEISEHLYISENTVKKHIQHIFSKLEIENRSEATLIARRAHSWDMT